MINFKLMTFIVLASVAVTCGGCVSNMFPGGPTPAGSLYTNVTSPAQMLTVAVDKDAKSMKQGEASASAIFGIFAFGDGGIDAAMKDGGITKVHHADHNVQLVLNGIFLKNTIIVYGE